MGPRPTKGFVGLKNAGATCYMNSVIQQLYMIPPIRNGILAIEGTGSDVDDDMSGDEKQDNEVRPHVPALSTICQAPPPVSAISKAFFTSKIITCSVFSDEYQRIWPGKATNYIYSCLG